MPLANGASLGPYQIAGPLGAGGMGEVYRARDTRLGRDVAIKILPPMFSTDSGRLARFEREARVLASLNHPHIATIHGVEEQDGIRALVMELVEGETLADRLRRGAIPLRESLDIARQIADALDAAHDKGIVHRDLKPANIKLSPDGGVKVLDFGLAKIDERRTDGDRLSDPPTVTIGGTKDGALLGTAAYMSPEQARGQAVDKRADAWAFGCVLYEMLSAKRAFAGNQISEILASVLAREPDLTTLPADVPAPVRALLRRCFEKDRHKRIADVRTALVFAEDMLALAAPNTPALEPQRISRRRVLVAGATALLIGGFATGGAVWLLTRREPPRVARSLVAIEPFDRRAPPEPGESRLPVGRPDRTAIALSPDGRTLVLRGRGDTAEQLFLRPLDRLEATPIAGTEGADSPFFSPDGATIGFWASGELRRVPAVGGPASTIAKIPGAGIGLIPGASASPRIYGASWGDGDVIVFANRDGLWRVHASGGQLEPLSKPADGEYSHRLPQVLPGGDAVLFTLIKTVLRWDDAEIAVQSIATGERKILFADAVDARYLSSGHIAFVRRGTLMAVPFDRSRLAITGVPVALITGVMQAVNMPTTDADSGAAQFAVANGGVLVYATGGMTPLNEGELVWVDRHGTSTPLSVERKEYYAPRLSPDGQRVAVFTPRSPIGGPQIWIYDLVRRTLAPLTREEDYGAWNIWSPDGTRILFTSASASGGRNLFSKVADGSGTSERLTTSEDDQSPGSWSADGKVAFVEVHPTTGMDIWVLDVRTSKRHVEPFLRTPAQERYPTFSPDGRWLAFTSTESGREEVYVQPYPGSGPRVAVSSNGGHSPAWSATELFYETTRPGAPLVMMAVPFSATETGFSIGTPRRLFEGRYGGASPGRGYDVTPDGRRFLMVRFDQPPPRPVSELVLVENWLEELKQRVPTK